MVSGNLGRAAAHKTVVDQPPWAEPLSLRLGLQPPTTDKHPKPVAIASGGHDGQMDGVPQPLKAIAVFQLRLLALPGSSWSFGSDR